MNYLHPWTECPAIIFFFILSICVMPVARAEDYDLTVRGWVDVLDTAQRGMSDTDSLAATYDKQLFAFTEFDESENIQLLKILIRRIDEIGNPNSLPALEHLINHSSGGFPTPSQIVANRVKREASSVWFRIRCQGANLDSRIRYGMYGLSPDSPVDVHSEVAAEAIKEFGSDARDQLYSLLRRNNLVFDGTHDLVALARTGQLLSLTEFLPTDDEVAEILNQEGLYGKAVMIHYLAVVRQDRRGIPAMRLWLESQIELSMRESILQQVYLVHNLTDAERKLLRATITSSAIRVLDSFERDTATSIFTLLNYLTTTNLMLKQLGPDPVSRSFFRRYIAFAEALDWQLLYDRLGQQPRYTYACMSTMNDGLEIARHGLEGD